MKLLDILYISRGGLIAIPDKKIVMAIKYQTRLHGIRCRRVEVLDPPETLMEELWLDSLERIIIRKKKRGS